jgi:GR25 family glycosyltransferase involved in LPS biosynthesis
MKSYCINLNRRADRWVLVREEFAKQGLHVTRFTAIDEKPGWVGCRESHLAVMEICKDEEIFAVFEDDVTFIEDMSYVNEAMSQLPKNWDALFLGASPQEPQERYSDNLFKLSNAWCTHSIIWHNRPNGAVEYILKHRQEIKKIDVFFSVAIYPNFNIFLMNPLICTQIQTQSDCCKRSDLSTIQFNYSKFCK